MCWSSWKQGKQTLSREPALHNQQLFHGLQPGNSGAKSIRFHSHLPLVWTWGTKTYFPKTRPSGSLLAGTSQGTSCLLLPPFTRNRTLGTATSGSCGVLASLKIRSSLNKVQSAACTKEGKHNTYSKELEVREAFCTQDNVPQLPKPPLPVALDCVRCICRRLWWQWLWRTSTHGFCSLTISFTVQ